MTAFACSFCGLTDQEATHVFLGPALGAHILAICSCCVRYCETVMSVEHHERIRSETKLTNHDASAFLEGWIY